MERRELFQIAAAATAAGQGKSYTPRFLTAAEWTAAEALALALLPEEPGSPGAAKAEVARYIDTVLLYADAAAQAEWRRGLALLKPEDFAQVAGPAELAPATEAERFFVTLKRLALEAYFQSPAGAELFGYQGNSAVGVFPGCASRKAGGNNPTPHRH